MILGYVRNPMCSICFLRDLLGKDLGTSELTLRALDRIVLSPVKEKVYYAFMLHTHFQLQKAKFRYAIQLSLCKKANKQSSKQIAPKSKNLLQRVLRLERFQQKSSFQTSLHVKDSNKKGAIRNQIIPAPNCKSSSKSQSQLQITNLSVSTCP